MPNAVVFSTIASARTFAGRLAARMGYPSPGVNARTGEPVQPGAPGWTISEYGLPVSGEIQEDFNETVP